MYKANEAYSRAQRADPAYINSWIGQASIAEMMQRKETMGLFRHAIQLGYHNQAAVGYAHWILNAILNSSTKKNTLHFESISITYSATDVMTWYVGKSISFLTYISIYYKMLIQNHTI